LLLYTLSPKQGERARVRGNKITYSFLRKTSGEYWGFGKRKKKQLKEDTKRQENHGRDERI
jgi:hypothetical protein